MTHTNLSNGVNNMAELFKTATPYVLLKRVLQKSTKKHESGLYLPPQDTETIVRCEVVESSENECWDVSYSIGAVVAVEEKRIKNTVLLNGELHIIADVNTILGEFQNLETYYT